MFDRQDGHSALEKMQNATHTRRKSSSKTKRTSAARGQQDECTLALGCIDDSRGLTVASAARSWQICPCAATPLNGSALALEARGTSLSPVKPHQGCFQPGPTWFKLQTFAVDQSQVQLKQTASWQRSGGPSVAVQRRQTSAVDNIDARH
ncbi:hypothetical protein CDD81_3231 [Ophiocordyceps australis]|uniref:Uncharacterized protein n=1 Tax=Ophiocordyceps australis TaxID=1399860 RepID=A0A2C5XWB8_9HYPO|nr:hypothetical protein CDD81_3231 [Ophiocordyceps australis]